MNLAPLPENLKYTRIVISEDGDERQDIYLGTEKVGEIDFNDYPNVRMTLNKQFMIYADEIYQEAKENDSLYDWMVEKDIYD